MIRSLRYVEPVSSFRSTFAYTNITHCSPAASSPRPTGADGLGGRRPREDLLDPLGMKEPPSRPKPSRPRPTTRGPSLDARGHGRGAVHPDLSLRASAAPARSTPPSRTWRAGSGCSSADGTLRGTPHRLAGEPRRRPGCRGSASTTSSPTPWAGCPADAERHIVWHNGGTTAFGAFVGMRARQGRRRHRAHQRDQRRLSRRDRRCGSSTGYSAIPRSTTSPRS